MEKMQHFINTNLDQIFLDALKAGHWTLAEATGYAIIDQGRKLPVRPGYPKNNVIGIENNQMTPDDSRFFAREDAWLARITTTEGK